MCIKFLPNFILLISKFIKSSDGIVLDLSTKTISMPLDANDESAKNDGISTAAKICRKRKMAQKEKTVKRRRKRIIEDDPYIISILETEIAIKENIENGLSNNNLSTENNNNDSILKGQNYICSHGEDQQYLFNIRNSLILLTDIKYYYLIGIVSPDINSMFKYTTYDMILSLYANKCKLISIFLSQIISILDNFYVFLINYQKNQYKIENLHKNVEFMNYELSLYVKIYAIFILLAETRPLITVYLHFICNNTNISDVIASKDKLRFYETKKSVAKKILLFLHEISQYQYEYIEALFVRLYTNVIIYKIYPEYVFDKTKKIYANCKKAEIIFSVTVLIRRIYFVLMFTTFCDFEKQMYYTFNKHKRNIKGWNKWVKLYSTDKEKMIKILETILKNELTIEQQNYLCMKGRMRIEQIIYLFTTKFEKYAKLKGLNCKITKNSEKNILPEKLNDKEKQPFHTMTYSYFFYVDDSVFLKFRNFCIEKLFI